jgi:hypothetical protein
MTKEQAEKLVAHLGEDERMDLLMYLAELFGFTVHKDKRRASYYLSTK